MSAINNLLIDGAALAGFLVAFEPGLTGVAIHEWLSLALAGALIVHLVLHWDWVIQVAARFFRKLWHESRLNFVLDVLLLMAFILVMTSGILISRSVVSVLGIRLAESPAWRFLHSLSANATLALTGLHFALHWKWIVNTVKRFVVLPVARLLPERGNQQSEPVKVEVEGR